MCGTTDDNALWYHYFPPWKPDYDKIGDIVYRIHVENEIGNEAQTDMTNLICSSTEYHNTPSENERHAFVTKKNWTWLRHYQNMFWASDLTSKPPLWLFFVVSMISCSFIQYANKYCMQYKNIYATICHVGLWLYHGKTQNENWFIFTLLFVVCHTKHSAQDIRRIPQLIPGHVPAILIYVVERFWRVPDWLMYWITKFDVLFFTWTPLFIHYGSVLQ